MSELSPNERKLLESVQQCYQQLAAEAKKKHSPVKEVSHCYLCDIAFAHIHPICFI